VLGAWLPSAALVLSLDFVAQLGTVLDVGEVRGPAAVGAAFTGMGKIGFGGAVLLAAVFRGYWRDTGLGM
jgi:hypothetical protein